MKKRFRDMDQCCLVSGEFPLGEGELYLDIVPTMNSITRGGHTYHRMSGASGTKVDGTTHAIYLRSDYAARAAERIRTEKQTGGAS